MGLYRHNRAPKRLRRIVSCWTSVGAAAFLITAASTVSVWRGYFYVELADDILAGSHADLRHLSADIVTRSSAHARHLPADEIETGSSGYPRHLKGSGSESESAYPDDPLIDKPYRDSDRKGWVIVHIIIIAYMLLGLNTVCDLYFTGALDEMVLKWNIKPDVAGATFMAAGGSAPELFTSLIGAVVSESDVGFGTIVGSAVFNILFVIGLCGFTAKVPIKLTWWPLARDCAYYVFGLCVLAIFAKTGGEIELWEAAILFLGYLGYCTIMYFNPTLEKLVLTRDKCEDVVTEITPVTPVADTGSTPGSVAAAADKHHHIRKTQGHFERRAPTLNRISTQTGLKEHVIDLDDSEEDSPKAGLPCIDATGGPADHCDRRASPTPELEDTAQLTKDEEEEEEEEDDIDALLFRPEGTLPHVLWCLSLPIYVVLYYGIPKPSERCFMATFGVSLLWIAGFSFFLVYCVEILGAVLGIHVIVMGFTLLAAGTSIPDLVSSMAVARAGEGDMAVSSSIGSNIFDILVGLPIPWIIKILFVEMAVEGNSDYKVKIRSPYIVVYVMILVAMVLCAVLAIHLLKWHLNKTLGIGMALLYAIFLLVVLSIEFSQPEELRW